MKFSYQPDDFEPLGADERCDNAYGFYHIGRLDESRREVALFFDALRLPSPAFLREGLWSMINRCTGRLISSGEMDLPPHELVVLLQKNIRPSRLFEIGANCEIVVVVAELSNHTIGDVDQALAVYTAYLGWGDVSAPSHFRTIINARQEYL